MSVCARTPLFWCALYLAHEPDAALCDIYLRASFRFTTSGSGKRVSSPKPKSPNQYSMAPARKKQWEGAKEEEDEDTDILSILSGPEQQEVPVWRPRVILNPKKTRKYHKARPRTIISQEMVVMVNTVDHIVAIVSRWRSRYPDVCGSKAFERFLRMGRRVWNSLVGMLLYTVRLLLSDGVCGCAHAVRWKFMLPLSWNSYCLGQRKSLPSYCVSCTH